jgi:hypothetical protein
MLRFNEMTECRGGGRWLQDWCRDEMKSSTALAAPVCNHPHLCETSGVIIDRPRNYTTELFSILFSISAPMDCLADASNCCRDCQT